MKTHLKVSAFLYIFFLLSFCFLEKAYSESYVKITGVSGVQAPPVCIGNPSMPDIVLDPSLAGNITVNVSTLGIPDGTKVKVKFKNEENINPPEGIIDQGMSTIPITLNAGNAKVLYIETDPFLPTITKSASNGRLDLDDSTVVLYHLDGNLTDAKSNSTNLNYCCSPALQYVEGISTNSKGIYFWGTKGTQEIRRVDKYPDPNGTGFTSTPDKWSAEFFIKPFKDAGSESWATFLLLDSHIASGFFLGKSPFTGENNKLVVSHSDSKGTAHTIEITNPLIVNNWSYIAITHDGHLFKLYINGEEKGSVVADGNLGPNPWGNFGIAAGSLWYGDHSAQLAIDEIRISSLARNKTELVNNTKELLGTNLHARTLLTPNNTNKKLTLVQDKNKKHKKIKKIILARDGGTLNALDGEAKADSDTVALFHFNGTTKDSVSKKVLIGDPEVIEFDEGKNQKDNGSISFEGKDDLLLVNKKLFPQEPIEWTIDFFSKPGDLVSPLPIGILTIDNGQIFAMISYQKLPDGKTTLSASALDGNKKPVVIGQEADFPSDKWTHFALIYKDKKIQFLINGKSLGEAELPTLYKKGDGAISVGSDGGDSIFTGQIDELRISDIARSQAELEVYAKR